MARRALVVLFIGTCVLTRAAATAEDARQSAALRRGCESGKTADCVTLARFSLDDSTAGRTMQKACQAGDAIGCGMLYWAGDLVPKDLARAAAEFKKACDAGRAVGCAALAEMHDTGQGVPKDPARSEALYHKAAVLLSPACHQGDGAACLDLAGLYHQGQGVPLDADRATALYAQGCRAGFAPACRMAALDSMAAKPMGTVSVEEFMAGLESACQAGGDWGCIQIAQIYKAGQGIKKDPAKAAEYFRKTAEIRQRRCDQGNPEACRGAEELYAGEGVPRIASSGPKPAAGKTAPPSLLQAGAPLVVAATFRETLGGAPVKAVELAIHDDHAVLRAPDPRRPENVGDYVLRDGRVADPERVTTLGQGDLKRALFALDDVNIAGLSTLMAESLQRVNLEGGKVTHVAVDRTFSKEVQIRVYVRGAGRSVMVVADRQGRILKIP